MVVFQVGQIIESATLKDIVLGKTNFTDSLFIVKLILFTHFVKSLFEKSFAPQHGISIYLFIPLNTIRNLDHKQKKIERVINLVDNIE